jgi:hypothetical protein
MIDWRISVGAVLGILISVFFAHRLTLLRENTKAIKQSIVEFKNLLVPFIQSLEDPDANPSILVVQNYSKHDEAARKLMNVLPRRKCKRFKNEWVEYTKLYNEKMNLGTVALTAAVVDDLSKARDPKYLYEQNEKRRIEVIEIIQNSINVL